MTTKPLSGKEIIEAAQKGIEVLYVYKSYNEFEKDRDLELRIVPKFMKEGTEIEIDEDETGCCWEVKDMEGVDSYLFDLDNGTEAVYAADVPTERERLKKKLAKFLHEEVGSPMMKEVLRAYRSFGRHLDPQWVIERDKASNAPYEELPISEQEALEIPAEKLLKLLQEEQ